MLIHVCGNEQKGASANELAGAILAEVTNKDGSIDVKGSSGVVAQHLLRQVLLSVLHG